MGLNGLCEATVAAKLRLIGRWMCEAAPSLQMAHTDQPSSLLKDAHPTDIRFAPAWSSVREDSRRRKRSELT